MVDKVFLSVLISVLIFCSLLHDVSLTLSISNNSHNVIQCPDPVTSLRPLYQSNVFEEGSFLKRKIRRFVFPVAGLNKCKITCLKITDQDIEGKGGSARIVSGGYGTYDVEIILRSDLGGDINYRIEVWSDE
ncbi:unnamed protein product [Acanthoscelides obtectus]|uniref:Uncharacterized protein n=1 Tax=Acanthoscelides obtectus TaxID=200917 RepID=A0A9P0KQ97_ACAOB|nr:unnamed protein product [Acanthoscelides obtectus]CAK1646559.1 hypothetical protein AOBTE_LOCUS14710 [Acanthoscelides obtectus]